MESSFSQLLSARIQLDIDSLFNGPPALSGDFIKPTLSIASDQNVTVAMELARRGFRVFPITRKQDGDWTPIVGWQDKSTSDPAAVTALWRQDPDARVGLPCGPGNGLSVLDVDVKGGRDGLETLRALGFAPEAMTPCASVTPSGGRHLFFRHDPRLRNWVGKLGDGLDVRAAGGYVLAPGSLKDGRRYDPQGAPLGSVELPPFPEALIPPAEPEREAGAPIEATPEQRAWARERLAEKVADLAALTEKGSGRNSAANALVMWAGGAAAHGMLTREETESAVLDACRANGHTTGGAEVRALRKTIASGWKAGLARPISDFPRAFDPEEAFDELEDLDALPTAAAEDWHVEAFDLEGEPDLSDDQLALDLGKAGWNRDARYCGPLGGWLLWDGQRWQQAPGAKPFTIVRSYLRAKANGLTAWAEKRAEKLDSKDAEKLGAWAHAQGRILRSAPKIAAIECTARSNRKSLVEPAQFDADDFILGTPGGTVDLRTGALSPADRSDYLTKLTAVTPASEGGRPSAWLDYLASCFPGSPEIPKFLQRLAGYALTGSTREHKAFFFHGDGRNGKGTFLNLLEWLMGNYSANVATSVLLESRNPQHSSPLAMLRGARLARGSEISGGSAWDESVLKRLTGGDPITANLMRQDPITFTPKLTLIIDANRRPRIRTVDAAMKARIVLVPWRQSFAGREDQTLGERLKAEGPAILRWAIEGAVAWHRDGLGIPDSIAAASHDYLETEDDLGQFLADHTAIDRTGRVGATALYRRFQHWQDEQGVRASWSQRALAGAMAERGFDAFKDRNGRGFVGLRLLDEGDPFAEEPL